MKFQSGFAFIPIIIVIAVLAGGGGGYWYEFQYRPAEYEKDLLKVLRDNMGNHPAAFGVKPPTGNFINPADSIEAELSAQESALAELKGQISGLKPPRFGAASRRHKELIMSLGGYLEFGIPDSKKIARFFGLAENIRLNLAKLFSLDDEPDAPGTIYNNLLLEIISVSGNYFGEKPEHLSIEENRQFKNLSYEWQKIKPLLVTVTVLQLKNAKQTIINNAGNLSNYSRMLDEFQERGLSVSSPSAIFFMTFGESSAVFKGFQKIHSELRGPGNVSAVEQELLPERQLIPAEKKQLIERPVIEQQAQTPVAEQKIPETKQPQPSLMQEPSTMWEDPAVFQGAWKFEAAYQQDANTKIFKKVFPGVYGGGYVAFRGNMMCEGELALTDFGIDSQGNIIPRPEAELSPCTYYEFSVSGNTITYTEDDSGHRQQIHNWQWAVAGDKLEVVYNASEYSYNTFDPSVSMVKKAYRKITNLPRYWPQPTSCTNKWGSGKAIAILKLTDLVYADPEKVCGVELINVGLTQFPSEILKFKNVESIVLQTNKIKELPREIGTLTKLTRLHLDYNELTTLPSEIGQLTELRYLVVDQNKLTYFPREMQNLKNLLGLHLRVNPLPQEEMEWVKKTFPFAIVGD